MLQWVTSQSPVDSVKLCLDRVWGWGDGLELWVSPLGKGLTWIKQKLSEQRVLGFSRPGRGLSPILCGRRHTMRRSLNSLLGQRCELRTPATAPTVRPRPFCQSLCGW